MGLLPEVLKPILLLSVLAFILASYFTSNSYLYGRTLDSFRISIPHVEELVCGERKAQERECAEIVKEALVPLYLHCMSPTNLLMACTEDRKLVPVQIDAEKSSCLDEVKAVNECRRETLKRELERRGFTPTEIGRLPQMLGGGGSLTFAGRESAKGGNSEHKRSPDDETKEREPEPEHEQRHAPKTAQDAPVVVESQGVKKGHTEKNDAS